MVRKYHGKTRRYFKYRGAHFTPVEAKELSSLHRLDYREVIIMVRQRRRLWRDFTRLAVNREWGPTRRKREWYGIVKEWYERNNYVEKGYAWWKKFPEKNVWIWFDAVSYSLPEEDRYTKNSRRLDKAKLEPYEKVEAKVMDRRIVEGLKIEARRNPANAPHLLGLARYHGFRGRSLL